MVWLWRGAKLPPKTKYPKNILTILDIYEESSWVYLGISEPSLMLMEAIWDQSCIFVGLFLFFLVCIGESEGILGQSLLTLELPWLYPEVVVPISGAQCSILDQYCIILSLSYFINARFRDQFFGTFGYFWKQFWNSWLLMSPWMISRTLSATYMRTSRPYGNVFGPHFSTTWTNLEPSWT